MNKFYRYIFLVVSLLFSTSIMMCGCSEGDIVTKVKSSPESKEAQSNAYFKKSLTLIKMIEGQTDKLLPLAVKMPPPKHGEWRTFWQEPEQSPQKYVLSMPSIVTDKLTTLYIKPIGEFNNADFVILDKIAEYLKASFQTPVIVMKNTNDLFPKEAVRENSNADKQVSSVYITDVLLKEQMPEDAWGVLAVTTDDIFRAEGIHKLYGDTLRYARRGVISLYYLKNGGKTSLSLALKGASHEATHLLSLPHCSEYRCNMNGRITLEEFGVAPLHYSPDCLCKVIFATGADMKKRFIDLIEFCRKNGLTQELDYYSRAHKIISNE